MMIFWKILVLDLLIPHPRVGVYHGDGHAGAVPAHLADEHHPPREVAVGDRVPARQLGVPPRHQLLRGSRTRGTFI